ncbi:type I 3-dehydroquinate dehydratase [Virgibacillus sp. NKC19-16]|uniref:type I 3-dehydroquinate dehydratase n=1 Tax=Virgibacillus salidurans TaxID=2831673 RepID=UPI001F39B5F7|nr:type I 3-dehydroquinate dehydratase [Virgibacillus sp. NKC19-16]UJL46261.1 type I 3-dehydroquinate dehydratase [Virgibacillus sp. NKC19-16]
MTAELFHNKKPPYICIPLTGKNKEEIHDELKMIIPKQPDLIEWRADFFEEIHDIDSVLAIAEEIATTSKTPILFTIRSEKEGGEKISVTQEEKVHLLSEICKSPGVAIIDFEVSNDPEHIRELRSVSKEHNKKLILSYHNFNFTPESSEIMKRVFKAEFYEADIVKVAVMPETKEDVLRLLEVTKEADDSLAIPIVTMSMGQMGSLSRIIGWAYGSIITFGLGVQSSAPGQVPIDDLRQMIEMVRETVGEWE